jgi:hypothetical protein
MATIRALVVLRNRKAWDRLHSQRIITGGSSHRMVTLLQAMLLIRKALSVRSNAIFKAAIADLVSGGFGWYCTYCATKATGIDGSPWVISVVMTRGIWYGGKRLQALGIARWPITKMSVWYALLGC